MMATLTESIIMLLSDGKPRSLSAIKRDLNRQDGAVREMVLDLVYRGKVRHQRIKHTDLYYGGRA